MFCTNCGKEIQADSNFCENCGAKVSSQPVPAAGQMELPVQKNSPSGSTQVDGKRGNIAGSMIALVVVAGLIFVVLNAGGALFGKGKELKAAEKTVISLVTQNYETIPTVKSEVLKDIGNHVLVIVEFEVEVSETLFDGSYLIDVSDTNQIILRMSDELPKDYDFEENLDLIIATWGI